MNLSLVVLAAGIGRRYGGLKQMDTVGPSGEILMDYSLYDAVRAGFDKVVFVIRRAFEAEFKERIGRRLGSSVPQEHVCQEMDAETPPGFSVPSGRDKPWGTAHAILVAERTIHGPFAVINADDFYGRHAYATLAAFLRGPHLPATDYCMVGFRLANTLSEFGHVSRGVCRVNAEGRVTDIVEVVKIAKTRGSIHRLSDENAVARSLTGAETVSMNMWGFTPALFDQLKPKFSRFLRNLDANPNAEFYIPTAVGELMKEGAASVTALKTDASWFGITYPEDKPKAARSIAALVEAGEYPSDSRF